MNFVSLVSPLFASTYALVLRGNKLRISFVLWRMQTILVQRFYRGHIWRQDLPSDHDNSVDPAVAFAI
jgi:hypothetical protein